ncbi:alpha/beta hydrolase [Leucobacter iarius]|uniref:AB hydrolase-1 domain-containing protein n=1 Tax=Leucobacter iarius TaxID=333963 RepID=A0ABP4XW88_9MICO
MRTLGRIVVRIMLGIIGAIALVLAATSAGNAIASSVEADQIVPYGTRVEVDGKKMNVVERGTGSRTVVLLPGFGTAAPGIDFEPLIAQLESKFRVVVVEPFGSGLSDDTDAPRTSERYVQEVHGALERLGIDRYAIAAHSIAGIYALAYADRYPDEVTAFIGIDSSVPGQPGTDDPLPIDLMRWMKWLGISRQLDAAGPDPLEGLPYSDEQRAQNRILSLRNSLSSAFVNEADATSVNFRNAEKLRFPTGLPVLLLVARDPNAPEPGWLDLHRRQAAQTPDGRVVELSGPHYLHHVQAPRIAEEIGKLLG